RSRRSPPLDRRWCAKGMPPRGRQWSSMPRSTPMLRTRLSGRGTAFRTGPLTSPGDEMVAAMDKVGVDGAIYISPFSMYQYDGSYAVSVQQAHPDKFALVKPVNPDDPAVADVIADWKKTPGTV